jgi:hypothetical protein
MKLSKETLLLLEDIEKRIDPETEEDFIRQWRDFLWNRFDGEIFNPERKRLSAPSFVTEPIHLNDILGNYDLGSPRGSGKREGIVCQKHQKQ